MSVAVMHQRTRGPSGGHTCRLKGLEGLFSSAQAGGSGGGGCRTSAAPPWVGLNVLRAGIDTQQYRAYRITGRSGLLAEAETTMRRAKRLLTETTGSGILNQWEDAKDAYLAAAACFAEAGEAVRGGEAYCLASDCVAKLGSDVETAWCLSKAAEVYGRTSPLDAIACLQRCAKLHIKHGRICKAAKVERQIAEAYERLYGLSGDTLELENVLLHYQQAESLYQEKGEQYTSERAACLDKIAGYRALLGEYADSICTFEALNRALPGDKIRGEGLFRAMLCYLARITVADRLPGIEQAQHAFGCYSDVEPQFQSGIEYDFVKSLLRAVTRQDTRAFDHAVSVYTSHRVPDHWTAFMLQKIEKNLAEVLDTIDKQTESFSGLRQHSTR